MENSMDRGRHPISSIIIIIVIIIIIIWLVDKHILNKLQEDIRII